MPDCQDPRSAAQDRLRRYEQPTPEELDREERETADQRHGIESAARDCPVSTSSSAATWWQRTYAIPRWIVWLVIAQTIVGLPRGIEIVVGWFS